MKQIREVKEDPELNLQISGGRQPWLREGRVKLGGGHLAITDNFPPKMVLRLVLRRYKCAYEFPKDLVHMQNLIQ